MRAKSVYPLDKHYTNTEIVFFTEHFLKFSDVTKWKRAHNLNEKTKI